MATGEIIDKFVSFDLAGIPIGASVYYTAAKQVASFLEGLAAHYVPIPPIVSGIGVSWALATPAAQNFLGKYGSHYSSMAAIGGATDAEFHISEELNKLLGKVENAITGGESGASEAITQQPTSSASAPVTKGYDDNVGAYGSVDAGDLASLYTNFNDQYKRGE